MNSQNRNPIMVTLLSALALYFPLSNALPESALQNVTVPKSLATAQGATTPPINPPHWQEKEPSERRRAVKLLCDFFGLQKTKKPPADDYCALASENRVTQNETENRVTQNEKVFRVGHLIATIPDPQDSRLDYL